MNIDRSAVNMEPLVDETGTSTTAKAGSPKRAGFAKKNQGPFLKGGKGGKGPSASQSKSKTTSGKFGKKASGHPQGKGANGKIR